MSLSEYVYAMGRGPGRARSLERHEAADAMRQILDGTADPHAVGALLMLMRYRGETAGEIAGFVDAMRARLTPWSEVGAALDWPSYAAGRSRGLPWFLLAARRVADAGIPVLIHGQNGVGNGPSSVRGGLAAAGIGVAADAAGARRLIARDGIAYAPLEAVDPRLKDLLDLRGVLGLRSAVNTCLRALNPAGAPTSVQGVFHPAYRTLQRGAAEILGQPRLAVIKGGGGEFERHPSKTITVEGLQACTPWRHEAPALVAETRRLAEVGGPDARLPSYHRRPLPDPFAEAIVAGTAELALMTAGAAPVTLADAS